MRRAGLALAALLLSLVSPACEGRPQSESAKSSDSQQQKKLTGPAVSIVDLTSGAPEVEKSSLFGAAGPKKSFDQLLVALDAVTKDKDSMSVLVKFGSANIGAARSQEIGEVLEKVKAKKKVVCHGDGFTNSTLMAAARGCSPTSCTSTSTSCRSASSRAPRSRSRATGRARRRVRRT